MGGDRDRSNGERSPGSGSTYASRAVLRYNSMIGAPGLALLVWCGSMAWLSAARPPDARSVVQAPTITPDPTSDSLVTDTPAVELRVDKSERCLCVWRGSQILRCYAIVLGSAPEGDKRMQGDGRTPEGSFHFRDKYPHARWHRFAWIDYPNAESERRFRARRTCGEIPQDARIGGELGLHGVPAGMDGLISAGIDWTLGCISMRNSDLDEIYALITPGRTVIHIAP